MEISQSTFVVVREGFVFKKEFPYAVKNFEGFPNFVLCVLVIDFQGHHRQKLWEVDRACPILVHLVYHVL